TIAWRDHIVVSFREEAIAVHPFQSVRLRLKLRSGSVQGKFAL
ncbi:Uncharacterized protein APZ42_006010, partial [Daphnia magna]